MKILFLSQLVPYPIDAGPKVRSYYVLRYLAEAGHEVTLAAFRRESDNVEAIAHLKKYCSATHTVLMRRSKLKDVYSLLASQINGIPFLIRRDAVTAMHQLLKELMAQNEFDAVHVDQLWMAQYAEGLKNFYPNIKLTLDQHNAVYLIPKRLADGESNYANKWFYNLESSRLKKYETAVIKQFDQVVWVTDEDRQIVTNSQSELEKSTVIPICVESSTNGTSLQSDPSSRIIFLGGLHWPPNAQGVLWFFKEIFPLIKQELPEASLTVIGKDPPFELNGNGVQVTGYVPDLAPYLAETAVFIVPLLAGGGMRVKILDAWNWGLPIVSTTIGAEGIAAVDQENMLIADTPEAFAKATISLLQRPDLAKKLVQNGRQTLEEEYDWQTVYRAWDKIYPND